VRSLAVGLAGLLALGLAWFPVGVAAQSAGKVPRVGVLDGGPPPTRWPSPLFLDALGRLGYVVGQNIVFERRYAAGVTDRLPALARALAGLDVDLILTNGTPATRAAKEATLRIPIVFNLSADPVRSGLVASFARPGGNLTGFAYGIYADKQLEVLKETMPGLSRVACLCPRDMLSLDAIRALQLQVQFLDPQSPAGLDRAFASARSGRAEAVLVSDVAWFSEAVLQRIADLAAGSRLPAIGPGKTFTVFGGLASYGPRAGQAPPRVLAYMDRILKGAKPADLPVEQPTIFELVINVKTAKALDLTIPQTLLLRADELIQ
jgi:ABC-type uncharacterized transport system substrate-binding protein